MRVSELLAEAAALPALESRMLLAWVLQKNRAWLAAHPEEPVSDELAAAFGSCRDRRLAGEPMAYILGEREFFGLPLASNPAALIPRPETELLVELALARIPQGQATRVLDLGTGSGAIALALAQARPQARVSAAEIADDALGLARRNAEHLRLGNVTLVRSDWYQHLPPGRWDLIVANPPYIAEDDPHLDQGDLRFEPRGALTPGGDGLGALRTIVAGAPARLTPHGALLVEHGFDQGLAVRGLFSAAGFHDVSTERDLGGQERVTSGALP